MKVKDSSLYKLVSFESTFDVLSLLQMNEDASQDDKMKRAIANMIDLETTLREKTRVSCFLLYCCTYTAKILKSLKHERLTRESSEIGLNPTSPHLGDSASLKSSNSANIYDSDEESESESVDAHSMMDMRSVHSLETRTFITEPKLQRKLHKEESKLSVRSMNLY